jgi:hypothetical protein
MTQETNSPIHSQELPALTQLHALTAKTYTLFELVSGHPNRIITEFPQLKRKTTQVKTEVGSWTIEQEGLSEEKTPNSPLPSKLALTFTASKQLQATTIEFVYEASTDRQRPQPYTARFKTSVLDQDYPRLASLNYKVNFPAPNPEIKVNEISATDLQLSYDEADRLLQQMIQSLRTA